MVNYNPSIRYPLQRNYTGGQKGTLYCISENVFGLSRKYPADLFSCNKNKARTFQELILYNTLKYIFLVHQNQTPSPYYQ